MSTRTFGARPVGGLLVVIGALGVLVLALDQIIWETAVMHAYGLIAFVIIDLAAGAFVFTKPSRLSLTTAGAWSALRIVIQIGDVLLGPSLGLTYVQFADYLFNPLATTAPNPTGVPGTLIDLIMILEVAVIWLALKERGSIGK